jgi:hypothetical protein
MYLEDKWEQNIYYDLTGKVSVREVMGKLLEGGLSEIEARQKVNNVIKKIKRDLRKTSFYKASAGLAVLAACGVFTLITGVVSARQAFVALLGFLAVTYYGIQMIFAVGYTHD